MPQTVLIVEDNEMNMKLFNDLLQAHGLNTLQTSSAIEAEKMAFKYKPDLMVLDIQLPDGNGLDVAQKLKSNEKFAKTPIIAVSAFAMKGDRDHFLAQGCDAYVAKPFSVGHFMDTINQYIKS